MARTLIIKNADFSVNKVATVEIEEEVPCTGITLDESTLAITSIGGTDTLTATVAPVDTTDAVIWSTSDSEVITVSGGTVTAVGCGTATITATCGNYSATCTITVTHIATGNDLVYSLNTYLGQDENRDYLNGGDLANYAQGYSEEGNLNLYLNSAGKHPYVIPKGANKIVLTGANFGAKVFYLSSTETPTGGMRAKAYPWGAHGANHDDLPYTDTIPSRASGGSYEGMDSVAFSFRYYGTISDSAMENLTVTFTA